MSAVTEVEQALARLCDELRARQVAKLPAERDLAERLGVSRNTVRRALDGMEENGVIRRVRGRAGGAFLTDVSVEPMDPERVPGIGTQRKVLRDLNQAVGVPRMLSEQGYNVGTQVVRAGLETPPDHVRAFFDLGDGQPVASLLRIRYADGEALSLEHAYFPAHRFPGLLHHRLNQSMYELLEREYDVRVARCSEEIEATLALPSVAGMLGIAADAPLLKLTRVAWDDGGEPLEYSIDLFRADRTRLTVRTGDSGDRVRPAALAEPA